MVSRGLASYADLGTSLGVEDLYILLEIITVDAYNERLANREE